jgi:hypothetical protein
VATIRAVALTIGGGGMRIGRGGRLRSLAVHRSRPATWAVAIVGIVATVVLAATVVACSGGGTTGAGCTGIHQEPFDPRSTQHLLPGASVPPYVTNPPTSGAHQVGYYPRGVVPNAIPDPVQVALLEDGFVVVQYRPTTGIGGLAALTKINPYVSVAPNPGLPQPVVATAWLSDMRCGSAAPGAVKDLERFVRARVGRGAQPVIPLSETAPGGVRPKLPGG